jgi:hypothetical protein
MRNLVVDNELRQGTWVSAALRSLGHLAGHGVGGALEVACAFSIFIQDR